MHLPRLLSASLLFLLPLPLLQQVGRAHHQAQLAVLVPGALRQAGEVFVDQGLAVHAGQALRLQVAAQAPIPAPQFGVFRM